jgi:hypothetical protein
LRAERIAHPGQRCASPLGKIALRSPHEVVRRHGNPASNAAGGTEVSAAAIVLLSWRLADQR